jgi:hypothetical protein
VVRSLSVPIIEYTRKHGRLTISDVVRFAGTTRSTLKQHFPQLVPEKLPTTKRCEEILQ